MDLMEIGKGADDYYRSQYADAAPHYGKRPIRGALATIGAHEKVSAKKREEMAPAATRERDYRHAGNGVFVKQRMFGRRNQKDTVAQLVRENAGSKTRVYANIGYRTPKERIAGVTVASAGSRDATMVLNQKLMPTKRNRLESKVTATHEMQHVRDRAGTTGIPRDYMASAIKAKRKVPVAITRGSRQRRADIMLDELARRAGATEGRADAAAAKRHGAPHSMVSGYPRLYRDEPLHGSGYVSGGGKLPEAWHGRREMVSDLRAYKKVARHGAQTASTVSRIRSRPGIALAAGTGIVGAGAITALRRRD